MGHKKIVVITPVWVDVNAWKYDDQFKKRSKKRNKTSIVEQESRKIGIERRPFVTTKCFMQRHHLQSVFEARKMEEERLKRAEVHKQRRRLVKIGKPKKENPSHTVDRWLSYRHLHEVAVWKLRNQRYLDKLRFFLRILRTTEGTSPTCDPRLHLLIDLPDLKLVGNRRPEEGEIDRGTAHLEVLDIEKTTEKVAVLWPRWIRSDGSDVHRASIDILKLPPQRVSFCPSSSAVTTLSKRIWWKHDDYGIDIAAHRFILALPCEFSEARNGIEQAHKICRTHSLTSKCPREVSKNLNYSNPLFDSASIGGSTRSIFASTVRTDCCCYVLS
ncbi:hypothetical protein QR680_007654 [Steinernema hermaphroditum]|uniref:Uncharacterized protein n=1 Tax=Steinernema hermaphroditum TaxID=289476 RepID=A0AA39IDV4_9BILA|nr:hypothetical protein QR680_007654 [Steinernema hermaphroditum]